MNKIERETKEQETEMKEDKDAKIKPCRGMREHENKNKKLTS